MELVCFWISDPIASLYAFGPSGSRAQTRTLVMRSDGGLAQNARFWSFNTTLEPEEKETVALMSSNESAPQTNVAHVDGTLTAGGENVLFDINMEVTGDTLSGGDYNCSATGTVFITDNS
jgi:hypothetical protein